MLFITCNSISLERDQPGVSSIVPSAAKTGRVAQASLCTRLKAISCTLAFVYLFIKIKGKLDLSPELKRGKQKICHLERKLAYCLTLISISGELLVWTVGKGLLQIHVAPRQRTTGSEALVGGEAGRK